jgi:phosphoserine phosphatase
LEVFRRVPLLPGVELVFKRLKRLGFKTALISSGLPDFVVSDLAFRLCADYAYGFILEYVNGMVTGRVSGDVLDKGGKGCVS